MVEINGNDDFILYQVIKFAISAREKSGIESNYFNKIWYIKDEKILISTNGICLRSVQNIDWQLETGFYSVDEILKSKKFFIHIYEQDSHDFIKLKYKQAFEKYNENNEIIEKYCGRKDKSIYGANRIIKKLPEENGINYDFLPEMFDWDVYQSGQQDEPIYLKSKIGNYILKSVIMPIRL